MAQNAPIPACCDRCGSTVEVTPPSLPPTGGCASFQDDPVAGWQVLEFTCGPCWAARRRDCTCVHCGNGGDEFAAWCRGCGWVRPGIPPYIPNWDLLAKEERERRREHDALVAEANREHPGWWLPPHRSRL